MEEVKTMASLVSSGFFNSLSAAVVQM